MKVLRNLAIYLVILMASSSIMSQNLLTSPESVSFDSIHNQYLVSNYYSGNIVAIDLEGNQSIWTSAGTIASGTCIKDSLLYVCSGTGVMVFNLNTTFPVWNVSVPATACDGIALDSSGFLYVVWPTESGIFKVDLSDNSVSRLVDNLPSERAQDIVYDVFNDRLIACCYESGSPIYGIDPHTGDVSVLATTAFNNFDGIVIDKEGAVYLSTHNPTAVIRYDNSFSSPPDIISMSGDQPAGLEYNARDNMIAVPDFSERALYIIDMSSYHPIVESTSVSYKSGEIIPQVGDTIEMVLTLENQRRTMTDVSVQVYSDDPYIEILNSAIAFAPTMNWGEVVVGPESFQIRVDESCPDPHIIGLEINILFAEGSARDSVFLYYGTTKGYDDDFESANPLWAHSVLNPVRLDEWHQESAVSHSGDFSWKCGGAGVDPHGDYNSASLVSPPVYLAPNSELTFWHKISAYAPEPSVGWTGGTVWIMTEDGNIAQIFPTGGYPYSFGNYVLASLDAGTDCYSGVVDWTEAVFDLSAYSGIVKIVFRFDSRTAFNVYEGWYIDDFLIEGDPEYICGDANGDESVNIADAGYIVNAIFFGGTRPDPEEAADANADGSMNITDASYLVNYIFFGGNPPCPG